MKTLLWICGLLWLALPRLQAQTDSLLVNGLPMSEIKSSVIIVRLDQVKMVDCCYTQVWIEHGQACATRTMPRKDRKRCLLLTGVDGEPMVFPTEVRALDFVSAQGWELACITAEDQVLPTRYYFRRAK
jgi:hypothetical protein